MPSLRGLREANERNGRSRARDNLSDKVHERIHDLETELRVLRHLLLQDSDTKNSGKPIRRVINGSGIDIRSLAKIIIQRFGPQSTVELREKLMEHYGKRVKLQSIPSSLSRHPSFIVENSEEKWELADPSVASATHRVSRMPSNPSSVPVMTRKVMTTLQTPLTVDEIVDFLAQDGKMVKAASVPIILHRDEGFKRMGEKWGLTGW